MISSRCRFFDAFNGYCCWVIEWQSSAQKQRAQNGEIRLSQTITESAYLIVIVDGTEEASIKWKTTKIAARKLSHFGARPLPKNVTKTRSPPRLQICDELLFTFQIAGYFS